MLLTTTTQIALALLLGSAQPQPPATLQPVDPGTVDLSANALSTRVIPIDQRLPTAFDQVFQVNPANGASLPATKPVFARKSGALTAVFPRSVYSGGKPVVPAGTRFLIGNDPALQAAPAVVTRAPSWNAVDRRASAPIDRVASNPTHNSTANTPPPSPEPAAASPFDAPAGMLTDESYRVRRVAELLKRAADAPEIGH